MRFPIAICAITILTSYTTLAFPQDYPNRSVRVVVPSSAGGSSDTLARLVAEKLHERLKQAFVVDNRPGAGQMIGAELVAKSAPDGYTLIFLGGTYTTSAATRSKLPFDPVTDLTGIAMAGEGPFILVVHPSLPVKSVKELIALARARPGELNFASAGTGSITHLVTELFAAQAKIHITHVPYRAGAPAATGVVGGHVEMMIGSMPLLLHHVKAKRLRALAVTSAKRSVVMPDLPTISEAAVPGYKAGQWWGMLAPARTPRSIIEMLNGEVNKILGTNEIKRSMEIDGAEPVMMSADEFTASVKNEIAKWRKVVKELNIKTR